MYGTAPRMGFFVPIFVDVFVDTSMRGAKPYRPIPNPPHRHSPTQPKRLPRFRQPVCARRKDPTRPDTCFPQPKGTAMHVISFQHRRQAERIASYLADTFGDTLGRDGDSPILSTARAHLVGFYAYTQGFDDTERRILSAYVRELAVAYIEEAQQ